MFLHLSPNTLKLQAKALPFIICLFFCSHLDAQKKLSLIVAVGNYSSSIGISSIASVNDIKYIKAALLKNGFLEKDIVTLVNSKATKKTILTALDQLIAKAKPSDIVVLHFAMHGQQIRDQATVELGMDEDDGYDEALLPFDVKRAQYYAGKYEGENHLRDEELGAKLLLLRNKLGDKGSLLVLLDACHSGNATRAMEFATSRGEPVPFVDPENPIKPLISIGNDTFFGSLDSNASNMVVISGSGPHQQNFQVEVMANGKKEELGALSYGFYKAMNELPEGSTYEDLFQKIKAFIQASHPNQLPMIEGNTEQLVFSGKYDAKKERINLSAVSGSAGTTDTTFKMDRGQMDGIENGMKVTIYKDGNLFCEGLIKRSDNFVSYGVANKSLKRGEAFEARPEVMANSKYDLSLKITDDAADKNSAKITSEVKNRLKSFPFLSFDGQKDLELIIQKENNQSYGLRIRDAAERILFDKYIEGDSISSAIEKELLTVLKNQRRAKYLRLMPDGGALASSIKVKLKSMSGEGDGTEFKRDESFKLEIKNLSGIKLFYAVIDLNPANEFSLIYPAMGKDGANYSIDKKSSVERILGVSPGSPLGREFIKVLVSKEPLDLRAVFEYRKKRDEMNSVEAVFNDLFDEVKSGPGKRTDVSSIKAEEVGMITVSFIVK